MNAAAAKLDELVGTIAKSSTAQWLDRVAFVFLVMTVVSAPHSIAATQTAWLAGMLFFTARLFFKPRPSLKGGPVGIVLLTLFAWTVVTAFTSYAPDISIIKLKQAGLFLIFFFVLGVVRSFKGVYFLAFALIASCMVNVLLMPIQRILGRGVEIVTIKSDTPLARAGFVAGDVLLSVDGKKVGLPEEVSTTIAGRREVKIKYQNLEFYYERTVDLQADAASAGEDPAAGITEWKRSRSWRAAGFYGHYTTYAEVLLLIGSLVFGIFVAAFLSKRKELSFATFIRPPDALANSGFGYFYTGIVAAFCFAAFCTALLLTVTRAPQLAFMIACFAILILGASRKWIIASLLIAIPVAAIGLILLQRSRNVTFIDEKGAGQVYRTMMWRDGVNLWTDSPRNFIFGVGMDSINRHACDWGLYDNCRMEFRSHFHSTPIQLAVERGLPGLMLWLILLGVYARTLRRSLKSDNGENVWRSGRLLPEHSSTVDRGIWLGALGGAVGFFISSLVHYNYGDGEVVMVFYLIMGLAVKLSLLAEPRHA